MDITNEELNVKMERPVYYEDLGRAHDCLLRCKDCQKLVTFDVIKKLGMCDKCGNRRFTQINIMSQEEWDDIKSGKINFEDRELFMAEFHGVEV